MPGYRVRWLRFDIVAGLTIWAMLVPESVEEAVGAAKRLEK